MPSTAKIAEKGPALKITKAPAPKPEEKTNGPAIADRETFHYFKGLIDAEDALVKAAQKRRKNVRRRASDAGLNLEILDLVRRKLEKEPETTANWAKDLIQGFKWAGIQPAVQLEMFEEDQPRRSAIQIAEQEGYIEGLEGKTAEGDRYDAAAETGQARMRGWNRGQEVIKKRFIEAQTGDAAKAA